MARIPLARVARTDDSHRVTTLELFFDLVFVFAITQVTALIAAEATALGALRGLVVIALLWWAWCSYAWLGKSGARRRGRTASEHRPRDGRGVRRRARDPGVVRRPAGWAVSPCRLRGQLCARPPRPPGGLLRRGRQRRRAAPDPAPDRRPRVGRRGGARRRRGARPAVPAAALGSGAPDRLRRRLPRPQRRLASRERRALRRTARSDRDRGAGRIDRGDRGRHGRLPPVMAGRRRRGARSGAHGVPPLVALLRRRRDRGRARARGQAGRRSRAARSRLLHLPALPDGGRRRLPRSRRQGRSCRTSPTRRITTCRSR